MRIGIDFDNTIVGYDTLFHTVAAERGLIPADLPRSKVAVRDHLRRTGREDIWTEMQGYVYGARMAEAEAYPGVLNFLRAARRAGALVSIVSHKTRHPFLGEPYDLHAAARAWVDANLMDAAEPLVDPANVFFELTKEAKLGRVAAQRCDFFIDDLPEILAHDAYPAGVVALLFDPDGAHAPNDRWASFRSWSGLHDYFDARWNRKPSTNA